MTNVVSTKGQSRRRGGDVFLEFIKQIRTFCREKGIADGKACRKWRQESVETRVLINQ